MRPRDRVRRAVDLDRAAHGVRMDPPRRLRPSRGGQRQRLTGSARFQAQFRGSSELIGATQSKSLRTWKLMCEQRRLRGRDSNPDYLIQSQASYH